MLKRRHSTPGMGSARIKSGRGRADSSNNKRLSGGGTIIVRSQSLPSLRGCTSYGRFVKIKGILKSVSVPGAIETKKSDIQNSNDDSDDSVSDHIASNVTFANIMIREYARTVGDNPSCSSGPPISISWEYDPKTKSFTVEEYENARPPRRTNIEMVVPRSIRHHMLRKDWDVPQSLIAASIRTNIRVKNQRRASVNRVGSGERFDEILENVSHNVKRALFLKKSVSRQAAKLEDEYDHVYDLRLQLYEESEAEYSSHHSRDTSRTATSFSASMGRSTSAAVVEDPNIISSPKTKPEETHSNSTKASPSASMVRPTSVAVIEDTNIISSPTTKPEETHPNSKNKTFNSHDDNNGKLSSKENVANAREGFDEATTPIDIRNSRSSSRKQLGLALSKIENDATSQNSKSNSGEFNAEVGFDDEFGPDFVNVKIEV